MHLEASAPKAQDPLLLPRPPPCTPKVAARTNHHPLFPQRGSSVLHDTQLVGGQPGSLTSVPVFSILGKEVKMHGAWEFPGGPRVGTEGFHCWGPGSLPGQGTEVLQATRHSQKKSAVPERPLSRGPGRPLQWMGLESSPPHPTVSLPRAYPSFTISSSPSEQGIQTGNPKAETWHQGCGPPVLEDGEARDGGA